VGLPWAHTLEALAHLPIGHFASDWRVFCVTVPTVSVPSGFPDACLLLCYSSDPDTLTLFFSCPAVVAICSSHSVLALLLQVQAPSAGVRLLKSGALSRFFPEYIRLKKKPTCDVMSVYMASDNWHKRLGPLDAVAATVAEGRTVMLKPRLPLRHCHWPNQLGVQRRRQDSAQPKFCYLDLARRGGDGTPGLPSPPLHRAAERRGQGHYTMVASHS
jgi:hypothetical protein